MMLTRLQTSPGPAHCICHLLRINALKNLTIFEQQTSDIIKITKTTNTTNSLMQAMVPPERKQTTQPSNS